MKAKEYMRISPVVVAVQWTGKNLLELMHFMNMFHVPPNKQFTVTVTCGTSGMLQLRNASQRSVYVPIGDYLVNELGKIEVYDKDVFKATYRELDTL